MAPQLKILGLPVAALSLTVVLVPVAQGLWALANDARLLTEWISYFGGERSSLLVHTLSLPLLVTAGASLLAVAGAAIWFYGDYVARRWLRVAFLLPLWIHPMALVFGLVLVLRQGRVADLLDSAFVWFGPHGGSWASTVGVMILLLYPLAAWPAVLAVRRVPPTLVAAARNLGAGPLRLFIDVVLPSQRDALWAGAALVYLQAAGFFVAPVLVGDGWVNTLPVLLADRLDAGMTDQAWVMALVLMMPLLALALLVVPRIVKGRLWAQ